MTVRFGQQPQYMVFIVYARERVLFTPFLPLSCPPSGALRMLSLARARALESWSVALCFWGRWRCSPERVSAAKLAPHFETSTRVALAHTLGM
jgi:hypothetical protein